MAIIKKSEFKQMNEAQLKNKLEELKKEMVKIRAQISMHTALENPGRVKAVRKTIARIHTSLKMKRTAQPEKKVTSQSKQIEKTKEDKTKKQ